MNSLLVQEFQRLIKYMEAEYLLLKASGDKKAINQYDFRIKANKRVLKILKGLDFKVTNSSDLHGIAGIGKNSYKRIDEIITTGKLSELDDSHNKETMEKVKALKELFDIHGINNATIRSLVLDHQIHNIEQLKEAVDKGTVKVNRSVLLGIKYHDIVKKNIPRQETKHICNYLEKMLKECCDGMELTICGSYRRGKKFSGDIDVLVYHREIETPVELKNSGRRLEKFVDLLRLEGFILDDITYKDYYRKYMGYCKYKKYPVRRIDMRFIPYRSLPTALLYFTGPMELNEHMRQEAKKRNMILNEYGLYPDRDTVNVMKDIPLHVESEKDVFTILGMDYLTPHQREQYNMFK